MKKSSKKGSSVVIIAVIIASITLTTGIVKAASLTVDSLTVGMQGVGGVTYFNGTIINNTTTNGADNPVTFGDNVRIDGYVYRGATAGAWTDDNMPFKINDSLQVAGDIKWYGVNSLHSNINNLIEADNAQIEHINDIEGFINCVDNPADDWSFCKILWRL